MIKFLSLWKFDFKGRTLSEIEIFVIAISLKLVSTNQPAVFEHESVVLIGGFREIITKLINTIKFLLSCFFSIITIVIIIH